MVADRQLCISADSHVVEPPEVYAGLDKRFGDRAPRMVEHPERGLITDHGDGTFGYPVGTFAVAGQDWGDPEVREKARQGFKHARAGVLDVSRRVEDQALDGIDAEVLYPSVLFSIYQLHDAEIMQATMTNYNDWVFNYASQAPGRLFSLALVQLYDLDMAIAEMERMAAKGAVGLSVPCMAPADKPFSDPYYDRFWAAAQDMNLPLTMHIFTGHVPNHGLPKEWGQHSYTGAHAGMIRTIQDLVWSGVCERFPGLRFVPTEFDTGWIAHFLYRDDYNFARMGAFRTHPQLKMKPSDYFHQNFCVTFEDDEVGIRTRDLIGVDNLLWGSDYPHADSLFPESQQVLERIFTGVSAADRYKITASNVCKLYGLPFEY
jgi:predicted TIM-barrel fold metal-dependent hydrolase